MVEIAKAEIHRLNQNVFVTGPWGHGPGVAAPDPADALAIGRLVRDALAYSRAHPEQTVFDQRGPTREEREAKHAWQAFCRSVAGSSARYRPEIRVEVLDLNDGVLRIRVLGDQGPSTEEETVLASDVEAEVIGRAVVRLLAGTSPSWPAIRSAAVHTDVHGRIVVYPYHGTSGAGPMRAGGPVRHLSGAAHDAALGATIRAALDDSTETGGSDRGAFDRALSDVGLEESDLAGRKMAWIQETTTGAIIVQPMRPQGGGWEAAGTGETTIEDGDTVRVASVTRTALDDIPTDQPTSAPTGMAFGYKTAWLAVRDSSAEQVADALGLVARAQVPWREGVDRSREDEVFVTPLTSGWVLAIAAGWFGAEPDIVELSGRLGTEVQYFATHRIVEAHTWASAIAGRLIRRVLYVGEDGTFEHEGVPTETERDLGLADVAGEDASARISEETVMHVAAGWSLDPRQLATTATPSSVGVRGRRPP